MEGERILKQLKAQKCLEQLAKDAKNYLSPVLLATSPPSAVTRCKLELFSLKLLKVALERAKTTDGLAPQLLELCRLSVASLRTCTGASGKAPYLSFEKLLLHFIQLLLGQGQLVEGTAMCAVLRESLGRVEGKEMEGDVLLKHAFELAWKAALSVESRFGMAKSGSGESSSTSTESVNLCLDLREEAFSCLLSVCDRDTVFATSRVLKTSQRYQRMTGGRRRQGRKECFHRLYCFHSSLLRLCDLPSLLSGLPEPTLAVEYMMHLAKVAHYAGRGRERGRWLERVEELFKPQERRGRKGKRTGGSEKVTTAGLALVHIMRLLVQLETWDPAGGEEGVRNMGEVLEIAAREVERTVKMSKPASTSLLLQVCEESVDVFSALEEKRGQTHKRNGSRAQRDHSSSSPPPPLFPANSFPHLYSLASSLVTLQEMRLRQAVEGCGNTVEVTTRSSQLSILQLVSNILLDMLLYEEECPDIETPRSCSAGPPITPSPPHSSPLRSPPPHSKQTLVTASLPLVELSQKIIKQSSTGVLSSEEHRWLGGGAYNLGLGLYRGGWVEEAGKVLEVACAELRLWCTAEEVEEKKWEETNLMNKSILLIECQREAGCYGGAIATLQSTVSSLPLSLLGEDIVCARIVSQWIRTRTEMEQQNYDQAAQWRGSTILSLVTAHHNCSFQHKVCYLEEEFKVSSNQIAAGRELLRLYCEAGQEWDGDRARVMVAMATKDKSLLDEALHILKNITSTPHTSTPHTSTHHTFTSLQRHRAQQQLAIGNVLKALQMMQRKISSIASLSAMKSHDQTGQKQGGSGDPDERFIVSAEEGVEFDCEDVQRCLCAAVEGWRVWGEGVSIGGGGDVTGNSSYYLQLTAALCSAIRQPQLAHISMGVLLKISKVPDSSLSTTTYQTTLASYSMLGIEKEEEEEEEVALLGAVREEEEVRGRAATELQLSYLSCRLALAARRLALGEHEQCRCLLLELFQDPLLSRHSLPSLHLTASTSLLTSHYLLTRRFQLKPLKEFLSYMLREKSGPLLCACPSLTAGEVTASAVKTLSSLAEHCATHGRGGGRSVQEEKVKKHKERKWQENTYEEKRQMVEDEEDDGEVLSSDPLSWGVLSSLLEGLQLVAKIYLSQGALQEALYYARQGASLTCRMALGPWIKVFVSLLVEAHQLRGSDHIATALTESLTYLPSSSTSSSPNKAIMDRLEAVRYQADQHLELQQPSLALQVCSEALDSLAHSSAKPSPALVGSGCGLALARLHYTAGVAAVREVQLSRPVLMEQLWANQTSQKPRKQSRAKRSSPLTWLTLVPAPFSLALSHFCFCLQLSQPVADVLLLRESYQWLALLLSPYHTPLSSHCLILSSQLSLSFRAALALRKRAQKSTSHHHNQQPFQDILSTLQDRAKPCPESCGRQSPLLAARNLILPPHLPPPLSFTQSLISSLPNHCQLTSILLTPSPNHQTSLLTPSTMSCDMSCDVSCDVSSASSSPAQPDHLIISIVGQGMEPLLVKAEINSEEVLGEFEAILLASEESLQLTDKRSWWTTRRRLDLRMKQLVENMETEWLGECGQILLSSSSSSSSAHLLCLDRLLQKLPWESTSFLASQSVGRTPSLAFTIAHHIIQTEPCHKGVDSSSGYYILNPRGDLPATAKRFSSWFSEGLGWRGVVSRPPSSLEYCQALERHDLFVYCGHGTGREYLSTNEFQQLRCRAITLLMGCGSGKLVVGGASDPSGTALSYLMAGCPSMVAVLWDVTDGDIDKLSKALLEHWLEEEEEEEEGRRGRRRGRTLPFSLSAVRSVCKLQGLNAYPVVVYGDPLVTVATSK